MDANNASVGPPKLVYILGLGHSGSTLLEMLLSSHPRLLGLGEVASLLTRGMRERHLSGPWPSPCSCGVLARDCPVWKPTLDQLQPDGPESSLDVLVADLVGRATQVTGKDILIDSSKTWHALDAWRTRAARWGWLPTDIAVLHLVRDVRGFVNSEMRRGKTMGQLAARRSSRLWRSVNQADVQHLSGSGLRVMRVGYEELAFAPHIILPSILRFLALPSADGDLSLAASRGHIGAGNPMRHTEGKRERLIYDYRWLLDKSCTAPWWYSRRLRELNASLVYNTLGSSLEGPLFAPPRAPETVVGPRGAEGRSRSE